MKKKPEINYEDLPDDGKVPQGYYHDNYPMPPPADFDTPFPDSDTKGKPKHNKGGRPKNLKIQKRKKLLQTRFYDLSKKKGLKTPKCLEILVKEFPEWTKSTIQTYLKK